VAHFVSLPRRIIRHHASRISGLVRFGNSASQIIR
jgi:hypothetical protein